jgi:UDP-N-acetylenolpyruvoylglucosamine reductase
MASNFTRDLWLSGARLCSKERDFGDRVRSFLLPQTLLESNYLLGNKTTIGIGGPVHWYAEPASIEDLKLLLRGAALSDIPFFIIGRGSNLLVSDKGYEGLVIRLSDSCWKEIKIEPDGIVLVGSGARLKEIAGQTAAAGLDGFAFLEGIPGTLGGALRMNAGAMSDSIFNRVESITWVSPDGEIHTQPRAYFNASYRDCPELHGAVIISAVLKASGFA